MLRGCVSYEFLCRKFTWARFGNTDYSGFARGFPEPTMNILVLIVNVFIVTCILGLFLGILLR